MTLSLHAAVPEESKHISYNSPHTFYMTLLSFQHGDALWYLRNWDDQVAPNGLQMKAIMEEQMQLAQGQNSNPEWQENLQTSQFTIPHWNNRNPFNRNYAQFVDNLKRPQVFAKHLLPNYAPNVNPAMRALRFLAKI